MMKNKLSKKQVCFILFSLLVAIFLIRQMVPLENTVLVAEAASAKSVKLSKTSLNLNKGKSYMLKVRNAGRKKVKWSVKNKKIAAVSSGGKVVAKKTGTTYVYAKVGSKKLKCKVIVKDPYVKEYSILKGDQKHLKFSDASGKTKWSTSNSAVSLSKSNGKAITIKGERVGKATVKAKTPGEKTYKFVITVKSNDEPIRPSEQEVPETEKPTIPPSPPSQTEKQYRESSYYYSCKEDIPEKFSLYIGEICYIVSYPSVIYTADWPGDPTTVSSDESVVQVISSGLGGIEAVGAGTATITVKGYDGIVLGTYTITVQADPETQTKYKLTSTNITLARGEEEEIRLIDSETEYGVGYVVNEIIWTSSNSDVVKMEESLSKDEVKLKAINAGTTTITARIPKFDISYSCTVTVTSSLFVTVHGVKFDLTYFPEKLTLQESGNLSVIPDKTINPKDITYKIANGNAELICDDSIPNLVCKDQSPEMYLNGMYYMPNWKDRIAFIEASYQPNMYLQYRVEIYSQLKPGSFPVSAYYKGTLICTCNVTIEVPGETAVHNQKFYEKVRDHAGWTNDMTPLQKIGAVGNVIRREYPYEQATCEEGALVALYAARDLGLKAWYEFTLTDDVEFYHDGHAFIGGHVRTNVEWNGKVYIFESQGY